MGASIFALSCSSGRLFVLKFEHEEVLSYDYDVSRGRSAKPKPTFGEIERTFVQNPMPCRRLRSSSCENRVTKSALSIVRFAGPAARMSLCDLSALAATRKTRLICSCGTASSAQFFDCEQRARDVQAELARSERLVRFLRHRYPAAIPGL